MDRRKQAKKRPGLPEAQPNGREAARHADAEIEGNTLFVFDYAGKTFAVPLHYVERVIEAGPVEPYPGEVFHCRGTTECNGRVVPLFDPHGLAFGVDADARVSYAVILIVGDTRFGLVLERYRELLKSCSLAHGPDTQDEGPADPRGRRYLTGLLNYASSTVALLSPHAIVAVVRETFGVQSVLLVDTVEEAAAAEDEQKKFMVSRLGDMSIAHPLEVTLEIVEGLEVTPVFSVDTCLRGLISLRGQVLACIDISQALGIAPRVLDERSIFLVLSAEGADFALCVDSVEGLQAFLPSSIQPVNDVLPPEAGALFSSLVEHDGVTHLCLSAAAVVGWERLAPFRAARANA